MADLASGVVKVTVEETTAEQPVSEALAQKIGSAVNALVDRTTNMDIKVFTSSGTWVKPSLMRKAIVICTGRGGNGGTRSNTSATSFGAGGGAGETAISWFEAGDLGETETVTLATNTSFGGHVEAIGGQNGANSVGSSAAEGGAAGRFSNGMLILTGQKGGNGSVSYGGAGGNSFWGGGGAGATHAINGQNASGYGSGGGGNNVVFGTTSGGSGICIVIELF